MTITQELFNKVVKIAFQENPPEHLDSCKHKNIPMDVAACNCLAFYWFTQGMHMYHAECMVKLATIEESDGIEIIESLYRTQRLGAVNWTEWNKIK